jgi:tetratricopeptide (TPR) repeat protein
VRCPLRIPTIDHLQSTAARVLISLLAALLALAILAPSSAGSQEVRVHSHAAGTTTGKAKLLSGLGSHHQRITTNNPLAQRFFDQGLSLAYAFNHAEAALSFREAARLDPRCAMCYWGAAFVLGPNINAAMDTAVARDAYERVQRAAALASNATPRERAYIAALAKRYAAGPLATRAPLDTAFALAMREVAKSYPDDDDAATIFAEATMDLSPWYYWNADGTPRPGTADALAALERVLARNANHPGACHYYIHAVESIYPERAVACAERLAALMPAAGHIVHMPGHIYIRVGRFNDAVEANIHAVHADETYIADQRPQGIYPLAYYPHNYHFMAFAATMAGRRAHAVEAARNVVRNVPVDVAAVVPELQLLVPYAHLTLASFGRWDEVLAEPTPPANLRFASAMVHYARGVAFAAKGRFSESAMALDSIRAIARGVTTSPHKEVLQIAEHALVGDIHARRGQTTNAIEHYRAAMAIEDGLSYMEPPYWHSPIRHSLGAALLTAGRAAEAELVYRQDLKRFPENGWSLVGLRKSLMVQGKTAEAEDVGRRLTAAWRMADVKIAASRY